MQFVILAHDAPDALPRRLEVRSKHLELCDAMKAKGELLYAAALLDGAEKMAGSMMVYEFPSRKELDAYLAVEVYVTAKVWGKIDVMPCKTGPSFAKK